MARTLQFISVDDTEHHKNLEVMLPNSLTHPWMCSTMSLSHGFSFWA